MISMLPLQQTNISSQPVRPMRILSAIWVWNWPEKEEALLLCHGLCSFLKSNFFLEFRPAKSEPCECCFSALRDVSDKINFKFYFQKNSTVYF